MTTGTTEAVRRALCDVDRQIKVLEAEREVYKAQAEQRADRCSELLTALEFIVNDVPEPGEDARLTAKGYNMACAAIGNGTVQS